MACLGLAVGLATSQVEGRLLRTARLPRTCRPARAGAAAAFARFAQRDI
jgi:hypothetical protein